MGPLPRAALRAATVAGGFTVAALVLGRGALPAPLRAAGILATAVALLCVLRRENRRLRRVIRDRRGVRARPRP
jgi:Flp pilus assembly protein TadB